MTQRHEHWSTEGAEAPRAAPPPPHPEWWKRTTVYQIYPRSFADGSGDGIGDLKGILDRLDYLHALGVETLWLSPFFKSPQADFGYDISDHFDVSPEYGTLDDVRRLIDAVHARDMKIVLDMVLNHTSIEHPWFQESRSSRASPKRDYYLWRPGRGPGGALPPNNWRSMVGGSGWQRDAATGEWYWASFLPFQPDLNYRNPEVKEAMLGVVRHWLEQGVDGLRLDIFNAIYKDASFADNPFSLRPVPTEDNPHGFFQEHKHTLDHPDTFEFARELRALADAFTDKPRFLVGEVFGDAETLRRYCGAEADGLHLVFLFKAMRARFESGAMRALIHEIERAFPEPFHPTYVFGNHDRPRSIYKLDHHPDKAKLLAALQLTVRGVPFIYYGEELGLGQHHIPLHEARDPIAARYRFVPGFLARWLRKFGILLNRDEARLPMPWSSGPNAGFSPPHTTPWLPVHPDSQRINVEAAERDPGSLLSVYRRLLALRRRSPSLHAGSLDLLDPAALPPSVLGYRRSHAGETAHVLLNFSDAPRPLPALDALNRAHAEVVSNQRGGLDSPPREIGPWEGIITVTR